MRVARGRVVSGKVVVEGDPLVEGATVTVLAPENGETFELNSEEEAALLASIEEAERGDVVDGEELLRELSNRG